jgi:hypothetical protein
MIVKGVRCPTCKDAIWSRGEHDLRRCSCGGSFIDGGREYLRAGGLVAKDLKKHLVDIILEPRDGRVWQSGGRYLTHREMSSDHLKNCIVHIRERVERSHEDEALGYMTFENREALQTIVDQMKEELGLRGIYNILGEVH